MNSKIVPNKRNSAILLATLLLAGGIIAFSNPSFIEEAQAQQEYYYEEMNGYDERPSYYGNENYEPREYPSYQSDDKQQYASYGKDNSYKSNKDSNNSVSINKLKCINNNVNINGNNNGTINVGNSGSSATGSGTDQGYLSVGSYGDNSEGYNKQKDQGFTCIINNNNTNTNIVSVGGNETEPLTCEECFRNILTPAEISNFTRTGITIGTYCEQILDVTSVRENILRLELSIRTGITGDRLDNLIECLREVGVVIIPEEQTGLNAQGGVSHLNTETTDTNDLQITQETGDLSELTALEKSTKLKQQWLELLP